MKEKLKLIREGKLSAEKNIKNFLDKIKYTKLIEFIQYFKMKPKLLL